MENNGEVAVGSIPGASRPADKSNESDKKGSGKTPTIPFLCIFSYLFQNTDDISTMHPYQQIYSIVGNTNVLHTRKKMHFGMLQKV